MWKLFRAVAILFVAQLACSSQGCSCLGKIPGGFPVAERRPRAIQVRATSDLFDYLNANGPTLLPKLLPGGSTFNVPSSCTGTAHVCCNTPMCRIQFDFQSLTLVPTAPNVLKLTVVLKLKTLDNLPVVALGSTCLTSIDSTRSGAQTMTLTADLAFPINATTNATELAMSNVNLADVDDGDFNFNEPGSGFLCGGLTALKGLVIPIFTSTIKSQLTDTVAQQSCMKCMMKDDCNAYASACTGGNCVLSDGKTCVQEVGVSGRMDVGSSLASFSPGNQAKLDLLAILGDYAKADNGLSLGMLGGAASAGHSTCVPQINPPAAVDVAPSATFTTNVTPDGRPYHLGIGVHKSFLDRAGYSAWDGGALCLNIGTASFGQLSSGTLQLLIPSLKDLTHDVNSPVYLVTRPEAPPTFTLGKGTYKLDSTGKRVMDEPLFWVTMPNFHLDFYLFVDQSYVRVMTMTADLRLPVGLDLDAMGQLQPALGALDKAFTNVRITDTDLLAETPQDLAQTFPMLLDLAGGQLGSALKPIALPALMGLNISPKAVTTTDPNGNGENQFLSIFADLSAASPATAAADTHAELLSLTLPPTKEFSVTTRGTSVPTARIALSGHAPGTTSLEYSYRLDTGSWSPWSQVDILEMTDPVLWLQARHHLEIRARAVDEPATTDPSPATLDLLVDTEPPEGRIESGPRIVAHDRVSPDSSLLYRWSVDGGAFTGYSPSMELPPVDPSHIVVQVKDEAGLVGELGFHGRSTDPAPAGCGCAVGGRSDGGGRTALVVLMVGLAVVCFRRRKAVFLMLMLGGCNSGLGKGDFAAPTDEIGRWSDLTVAADGTLHLAAYDTTTGDLVYAHANKTTDTLGWQIVDGVDLTADVVTPGDYRHGMVDPGPDVGTYTSVAVTSSGAPRISYTDTTNNAVKLALGPHPFRLISVEAGKTGELLGQFTALSLNKAGVPQIAYMVTGISDGKGAFRSELRVATASSASPSGPSDFTIAVADHTAIPCAGRCDAGKACIQTTMVGGMPNGDPSLSTCVAVTATCPSACSATQACIAGVCTTFLAVTSPTDWPEGVGLFTQARRDSNDALALVYHDRTQGDLKLATQSADKTFAVSFLDGNSSGTDVGQFCTAGFDAAGVLHVAYVDAIANKLLYRSVTNGTPAAVEVIDSGDRNDGQHPVGPASLLAGDKIRVAYQDARTADLNLAIRAGGWTSSVLQNGFPGYGFFPHLASATDGTTYLSQFVFDQGVVNPMGRLQLTTLK